MQEVVSKLNKMDVSITDDVQVMASFSQDGTCKIAIADDTGYTQYSFTASGTGSITEEIANADNVFVEKEYVGNEYGQGGSETPGGDIDINEDAATIAENLNPILDKVQQLRLGSNYEISDIRWDFGDMQDGEIDTIKLGCVVTNSYGNQQYVVYTINLQSTITANDLVGNTSLINSLANQMSRPDILESYVCDYNPTELDSDLKKSLVDAVAEHLITDGFNADLDGTIKLYTNRGPFVSQSGEENRFTVIFINDEGIREFNFTTPYSSNLHDMINSIKTENVKIYETKSVDFSENQIVVDAIS